MALQIWGFSANRLHVRPGERYGIEVEAEGCPHDAVDELRWSDQFRKYWGTTSDGSLRNGGIEFLSKPLPRTYVPPAIEALWQYFREGRMVPSVRTGIHIHANCLGMDTDQVKRMLLHYALVEPEMFAFVGPAREENIYCIPWYRGLDEPAAVRGYLHNPIGRYELEINPDRRDPCKYSAVYVAPLGSFGSVEFRHAPTWTDSTTMLRWWQMVQAVWRTHSTTYDIMQKWYELGPVGFARMVMPFDWIGNVPEQTYHDLDVESVAHTLEGPGEVPSVAWGRAPELTVEAAGPVRQVPDGTLTVNVAAWARPRRSRAQMLLDDYRANVHVDELFAEESDEDGDEWREGPDDGYEERDEEDEEES